MRTSTKTSKTHNYKQNNQNSTKVHKYTQKNIQTNKKR